MYHMNHANRNRSFYEGSDPHSIYNRPCINVLRHHPVGITRQRGPTYHKLYQSMARDSDHNQYSTGTSEKYSNVFRMDNSNTFTPDFGKAVSDAFIEKRNKRQELTEVQYPRNMKYSELPTLEGALQNSKQFRSCIDILNLKGNTFMNDSGSIPSIIKIKSSMRSASLDITSPWNNEHIEDACNNFAPTLNGATENGSKHSAVFGFRSNNGYSNGFETREISNSSECSRVLHCNPVSNDNHINGESIPNLSHDCFDDMDHYIRIKIGDHITRRYEILDIIGKGSFGTVVKALDHRENTTVALKIIRSDPKSSAQAREEVKILLILRSLNANKYTVDIRDSFEFRNHCCMVFDLLGSNLYQLLEKRNFRGISQHRVSVMTDHILKCLKTLKESDENGYGHCDLCVHVDSKVLYPRWRRDENGTSQLSFIRIRINRMAQVIHCDLKPENILLPSDNSDAVRVIDFGSSCLLNQQVYSYIQSRFYRAPEIILSSFPYSQAIDIWSLGCIVAELITGTPLFPGQTENEMMIMIMELLGLPDLAMIKKSERASKYFTVHGQPRYQLEQRRSHQLLLPGSGLHERSPTTHDLHSRSPGTLDLATALTTPRRSAVALHSQSTGASCRELLDDDLVDFILQCLRWNPSERIKPQEALRHAWIVKHNESSNGFGQKCLGSVKTVTGITSSTFEPKFECSISNETMALSDEMKMIKIRPHPAQLTTNWRTMHEGQLNGTSSDRPAYRTSFVKASTYDHESDRRKDKHSLPLSSRRIKGHSVIHNNDYRRTSLLNPNSYLYNPPGRTGYNGLNNSRFLHSNDHLDSYIGTNGLPVKSYHFRHDLSPYRYQPVHWNGTQVDYARRWHR